MKKKVTFEKKIEFPTMIGEICAISLEHNLKFIDETNINGDLLLTGNYKLTEASRLEEEFNYTIPTEISLLERIDLNTSNIEITDFYYEIENDNTLVCHIELLIEGLEIIDDIEEDEDKNISKEVEDDKRECDGDISIQEVEIPIEVEEDNNIEENIDNKGDNSMDIDINKNNDNTSAYINDENNNTSVFNLDEDTDTYGTFLVYIVRQNESINSIIEKYNTTIEELEKYNDINNINIGTKLIIPLVNE